MLLRTIHSCEKEMGTKMANRRTELFNPDASQWLPGPHFTSSTSFRFSPCIARVVSLSCALYLQGCYGPLDNTIKDVHGPEHGATVARIAKLAQENTEGLKHPYSPIREPSLEANDTAVGGTEKEHMETSMVAHAQDRPNPEWDHAKGPPQYCLALSGGGIRAAAYARGVLQGLSEADDPHGWEHGKPRHRVSRLGKKLCSKLVYGQTRRPVAQCFRDAEQL